MNTATPTHSSAGSRGSTSPVSASGGSRGREDQRRLANGPEAALQAVVRTIGHGTRTTDEIAALLHDAGVSALIDVRRYPSGRRQPHLARERLAEDLPARGIRYEWWGEPLGGRRSADTSGLAETGWRSPAFAAYRTYMARPEFRAALAGLEERANAGETLAIMCAETLWWRCHRRLIADALTRDGFGVEHLIDRVPGQPHRLSMVDGS